MDAGDNPTKRSDRVSFMEIEVLAQRLIRYLGPNAARKACADHHWQRALEKINDNN